MTGRTATQRWSARDIYMILMRETILLAEETGTLRLNRRHDTRQYFEMDVMRRNISLTRGYANGHSLRHRRFIAHARKADDIWSPKCRYILSWSLCPIHVTLYSAITTHKRTSPITPNATHFRHCFNTARLPVQWALPIYRQSTLFRECW